MFRQIAAVLVLLVHCLSIAACAQAPARVTQRESPPRQATPASVAPAPQTDAAATAAPSTGEYRLGPGDVIKVTVYNHPDLATETEISLGGRIGFPLVGEVAVGGMTRSEAEKAISGSLGTGGFVPNAHVNLLVAQYRSQQVAVMGEVNKPGNYSITKATSVTELLAMAGGITAKGSNVITITRKDGNGGAVQREIDVKKLLAGNAAANLRLGSDDIIFVPPMPVFYIYGEVRQPGSYPIASEMTVRQALSVGGGLTLRGSERGIRLERKGKDGKMQTRGASLADRLQANDVVHVPEGWF
ncbi:MAG: polysaccharide export protein EpsE [Betaproteobacteria bacterium]|nr:polysaccharide export protein EpsE [Betaproteobacteria bacterium]